MTQSPQPYPLPPENPLLNLSPVRSGPFAARNNDARYVEHVKTIKELLDSLSLDMKATKEDFADLSSRSKDNGYALEKLMKEIKGAREDDGVSQKLTGLAQLDRLDQLSQLNQLKKLSGIEETLKNVINLTQEGSNKGEGSPDLSELRQLGQLSLLEHLKKLENLAPMNSKLKHLERLNRLDELSKLNDLKKLEELTQLRVLSPMQTKLLELGNLTKLNQLDRLNELSGLNQLNKLDQLENLAKLSQLDRLNKLDSIENLESLNGLKKLSELSNLSKLSRLDDLDHLSHLGKLDDLSKLNELTKLEGISGEVRGIQDILVGIHRSTLDELKELRNYKQQHTSLSELLSQKEFLQDEVKHLNHEAKVARDNVVSLNTELNIGIKRLEEIESSYSKLEYQLREMAISKYKGILGTGALAVLSSSQQNFNDKENSIVIPKRQLRTVSLAER